MHTYLNFEGSSAALIMTQLNAIPTLDGSNYATWRDKLTMLLELSDLDFALTHAYPTPPVEGENGYDDRFFKYGIEKAKWEASNKKCLTIIKHSMGDAVKGAITDSETATEYLDKVQAQFTGSSKAYASSLTRQFINAKYDGSGMRAYIQKMTAMAGRLNKYFNAPLPDEFIVQVIMESLPKEFEAFHIAYNNTVASNWTLDQLMAQCVQEEERQKSRGESVNLTQQKLKKKNANSKQAFKKPGQGGQGSQGAQ